MNKSVISWAGMGMLFVEIGIVAIAVGAWLLNIIDWSFLTVQFAVVFGIVAYNVLAFTLLMMGVLSDNPEKEREDCYY